MTPTRILLATAVLLSLTACKPDAAVQKGAVIGNGTSPVTSPPGPSTPPAPFTGPTGAISGTVLFSGKAPAPVKIDTSMDPACSLGDATPVFSEQYAVHDGKLANVFVYVKQGPPAAMQPAPVMPPAVLDQRGCRYVPHVVALPAGGIIEFRNSDPTMHNIHTMPTTVGNETIDISQGPKGAPITKHLDHAELMMPVRCNNHPWMNAFINVAPNAFFAVTGPDGHFDLRGLPAGNYTLGAVQEKLGEKTVNVTVPANTTTKADLSFSLTK